MKRVILMSVMVALFSISAQADELGEESAGYVKNVQKWSDLIHADESLKPQVIQAKTGLPYEPKLIRYTNSEGVLKRVKVEFQTDFGMIRESYYFHQGRLVYIYASDQFRQFVGVEKIKTDQSETINVASQQRYYFKGEECVLSLEKQAEAKLFHDLKELLLKAENVPFDAAEGENEYLRKALMVSQIKDESDLKKFVATFTK